MRSGDIGDVGDGGLPFLSLTSLAIALFRFGAGGLGADFAGLPSGVSIGVGAGVGVALVGVFRGLLLPYMLRQQSNSHFGRASYLGMTGRVELPIEPDGWGEITIADPDGGARAAQGQNRGICNAQSRCAGVHLRCRRRIRTGWWRFRHWTDGSPVPQKT